MYKINYWLNKLDKYRSPLDATPTRSIDEVFLLLSELSMHEDDEIGIHTDSDTSQFTIELDGDDKYYVELSLTARYTKEVSKTELILLLDSFDRLRLDPKSFDFNLEPD